jgi:hypothetical protein
VALRDKVTGTSTNTFAIGDGSAGDKYLQAETAAATLPFVRYNDTDKKWEACHDGVDSHRLGGYRQHIENKITVDTTTTSTTYVNLMSGNMTTKAGGTLLIFVSISHTQTNTNQQTSFRIQVDGVTVAAAGTRVPSGGAPISCVFNLAVPVDPGPHTLTLQWGVTGGTASIRPVTAPQWEHASAVGIEVGE